MKPLTGMNWLRDHIAKLETTTSKFKGEISKIKSIDSKVYNEFQAWTPLKLILLDYALDVCTTIIRKIPFFKEMYFVDLFAGSGINRVRGKGDFLIGSPFIAALSYSEAYKSMLFCESDSQRAKTLASRLKKIKKKNVKVFPKRCEDVLDDIIKEVGGNNKYSFFFIDPTSTQFGWNSMEKVLNVRSDIVFNFVTSEISRALGLVKKDISEGGKLTFMFGDDSWKNAENGEELIEKFKQKIRKVRPRAPIKTIKIQSGKHGFCYHLFFITNETKKGNPWLKAIDKAKKEIESNSDIAVEKALDLVKGRQKDLSSFL